MMAVEASDFDDDDGPVVFKRHSSTSKKNLLNPEIKKSSSQGSDGRANPSNGENPTALKCKNVPSSKALPVRSSAPHSKGSTSDVSSSPWKTSLAIPKTSNSAGIERKPLLRQTSNGTVMKAKNPGKHPREVNEDSDDSEDDRPLSEKLKVSSNNAYKDNISPKIEPLESSVSKSIIKGEDSDDEVPLSSRFSFNSKVGTSAIKDDDSYEHKPFTSKIQKDGFSSRENQVKSNSVFLKRKLEKSSVEESSIKKLKPSDSSMSMKNKPETFRQEPKAMDDDAPIVQRLKKVSEKKALSAEKKITKIATSEKVSKGMENKFKSGGDSEYSKSTKLSPSSGDGQKKWTTLVHNGVIFPPPYKPHGVKILYKNKEVGLTPEQEEVATMYAMMLDTDYMQKPKFKENFWNDWRKMLGKNHVIQNLEDCDFRPIYDWYQQEKDKKKQMSAEEKKALKEEKAKQEEKYMWVIVDGVKEKVGNFRVEPPGLFRGRGDHPKMGKLKKRIHPSDIVINIGKDAPVPECPIAGGSWKEVRHDNTVTWLAYWNDPINPKLFKYVFLAASSSLKGQSDKEKYEKARMLKDYIENIRAAYRRDFTNKDATRRQIAVATYLIDKLALRAGNEKDDEEAADTVGCCTLKVENVEPRPPNTLHFDFLGKDSIRYEKDHQVDILAYNAIISFRKGKRPAEPLFDQLDTTKLNAHLKELMPGLTAKVFRTYNASITLDKMLNEGTLDGDVAQKIIVYQQANKEVAIICNHQRTVSKSHATQMSKLSEKIEELEDVLKELKVDLDRARKGKPPSKSPDGKRKKSLTPDALEKKIAQTNAKIEKMRKNKETKEDLKEIALGTSKINYLDPRITVAWCKRQDVPIEKIFTKSLLAKFAWAMDVDPEFRF